jgi:hypothetical protein
MSEWRPISEAPTDGTRVILESPLGIHIGAFRSLIPPTYWTREGINDIRLLRSYPPTKFHPLPESDK